MVLNLAIVRREDVGCSGGAGFPRLWIIPFDFGSSPGQSLPNFRPEYRDLSM